MLGMAHFDFSFRVSAPIDRVAEFHRDARALPRLTPPPIFIQLHHVEPLAEGSRVDMTMWFGPLPVRWVAVHDQVEALSGFRDTAVRSPLRFWRHEHRFSVVDAQTTEIHEHVEYVHANGWAGVLSRVLFNPPGLWFLFAYRRLATRRALRAVS